MVADLADTVRLEGRSVPGPIDVFLSYAAADDALAVELEQHLSVLNREGL